MLNILNGLKNKNTSETLLTGEMPLYRHLKHQETYEKVHEV